MQSASTQRTETEEKTFVNMRVVPLLLPLFVAPS